MPNFLLAQVQLKYGGANLARYQAALHGAGQTCLVTASSERAGLLETSYAQRH